MIKSFAMKALPVLAVLASLFVGGSSSKISDESYRLVRKLVVYKNQELDFYEKLSEVAVDCYNVPDEQLAAKNCTDRTAKLNDSEREIDVERRVVANEIGKHIREHKDEEWIFLGLMVDDKEFSNFKR